MCCRLACHRGWSTLSNDRVDTCFPHQVLLRFGTQLALAQCVRIENCQNCQKTTPQRTKPTGEHQCLCLTGRQPFKPYVPPLHAALPAATSAKYLIDTYYWSPDPARPSHWNGCRNMSLEQHVLHLWSTASQRERGGRTHDSNTHRVPAGLHDEIHVTPCNHSSSAENLFQI